MVTHTAAIVPEGMLTYSQAAAMLGVGSTTLIRWIREGRVRPVKLTQRTAYVPRAEIARLLAGTPAAK